MLWSCRRGIFDLICPSDRDPHLQLTSVLWISQLSEINGSQASVQPLSKLSQKLVSFHLDHAEWAETASSGTAEQTDDMAWLYMQSALKAINAATRVKVISAWPARTHNIFRTRISACRREWCICRSKVATVVLIALHVRFRRIWEIFQPAVGDFHEYYACSCLCYY